MPLNTETGATPRGRRPRRKSTMAVLFLVLLGLVLVQLHDQGYAVLIGIKGPDSDPQTGMARLSCTYFTGTGRVINHVFSRPDASKRARCALTTKLPEIEMYAGSAPPASGTNAGK